MLLDPLPHWFLLYILVTKRDYSELELSSKLYCNLLPLELYSNYTFSLLPLEQVQVDIAIFFFFFVPFLIICYSQQVSLTFDFCISELVGYSQCVILSTRLKCTSLSFLSHCTKLFCFLFYFIEDLCQYNINRFSTL